MIFFERHLQSPFRSLILWQDHLHVQQRNMNRVAPLNIAMDLDQLRHKSLCPELCCVDADMLSKLVPSQRLFFFSHDECIMDRFRNFGVVPWVHS